MLHTKFRGNPLAGTGDNIIYYIIIIIIRVFTIYGSGGHFGYVTIIMSSDFHFLVPESFHKKWFRLAQ